MHPWPQKNAVVFHRFTGLNRHSLRNGFAVSFVLSPVIGHCCHRHPQEALASEELDASLEASGPHDFADRKLRRSSACAVSRPSLPAPNVRDDRDTPLLRARDNGR
jgi:hypothetical protein